MGNAAAFSQGLKSFGKTIRSKAKSELDELTLKAYRTVTEDPEFPVDTRRAQSSFAISVGEPGDYVPPEVNRAGRKKGDGPLLTPQPAETFAGLLEAAPLEAKRVVYSNLEYIQFVELGTDTREGAHRMKVAAQTLAADGGTRE